jgi:hypothetical protein
VEINGSSMSIFAFPYGENVLLVVAADGKVKDEISELVECL